MAEGIRFTDSVETSDEDDDLETGSTKKKKKSSAKIGATLIDAPKNAETTEQTRELKGFEKLWAEVTGSKDAKAEKAAEIDKAEKVLLEHTNENQANIEAETTDAAVEDAPKFQKYETYDLPDGSVGAGEFIIDLKHVAEGELPMQEADVPLAENAETNDEEAEPTKAEVVQPEAATEELDDDDEQTTPIVASTAVSGATSGTSGGGSGSSGAGSTPGHPTPPPTGAPTTSGGGAGRRGGPPAPPVTPPAGPPPGAARAPQPPNWFNQLPTPINPNTVQLPQPNTLDQVLANQLAVEEARLRGRRRGRGEGLLAGLIIGGGIEHIRHKRREKKMEKRAAKERAEQTKKFDEVTAEQYRLRLQQTEAARAAEKERYKHESSLAYEQKRAATAEHVAAQLKTSKATAVERLGDVPKTAEETGRMEHERVRAILENQKAAEKLEIPEEHRIQTSAWHSIEVDKHGKAVENPSIEYGHEYYRERQLEAGIPQDIGAKTGLAAISAAMTSSSNGQAEAANSSVKTTQPGDGVLPSVQASSQAQTSKDDDSADRTSSNDATITIVLVVALAVVVTLIAIFL